MTDRRALPSAPPAAVRPAPATHRALPPAPPAAVRPTPATHRALPPAPPAAVRRAPAISRALRPLGAVRPLGALLALLLAAGAGYTVQPGDTLSHIAARLGVGVRDLAAANALTNPNRIIAGQRLEVPAGGALSQAPAGAPQAAGQPAAATHTVAVGENLARIAARYGVTVQALAAANDLPDPNRIVAGQTLNLPSGAGGAGGAGTPSGGVGVTHTVAAGENLARIAARYGVAVSQILDANEISNPNLIRIGQTLAVPGGTGAAASGGAGSAPAAAPPRAEVGALLEQTAGRYGWNPAFVKAVAWQESGWQQNVRSRADAIGIMQVLPGTGEFVSRYVVRRPLDLHVPADNVEAGVAFLDYLYRVTGGDARMTLAGYYQGLASVRRNGMFPSTERYIANVFALRDRFR